MEEEVLNQQKQSNPSPQQGSDKFWKITTVVLIALLAIFLLKGGNNETNPTGQAVANAPTPSAAAPTVEVSIDDDAILGDENAPVTIVEFSDYQCPFCGRFHQETLPQIKSQYIDTGKVRLVYRDFPLSFHPEATPAAIAANCAGEQGKYYEFHDKIFENQASLGSVSYKQWATELGLDINKWETCLSDPNQAAEIRADFNDGGSYGVQGTPAFFVNGKLVSGAQPFGVFQQLIEAELQ